MKLTHLPLALAASCCLCLSALAAQENEEAAELAKQLSNPVASLISVPFQANWDFNIGLNRATRFTLNVQPVVPISLGENANLIVRTIVPIISAGSPAPGVRSATGLGDITQSFFFSPKKPVGGWILALGPVFLYPSATDDLLGGQNWGIGPTALALRQSGGLTLGVLANHLASFAGHGPKSLNTTFLQPFVSYNTKSHTTFGLNAESTYDWNRGQWTVPINLTVGQLFKIGKQPMQVTIGGRVYATGPDDGPDWGLRFVYTLLFPTAKPVSRPDPTPK